MFTLTQFKATTLRGVLSQYGRITLFYLAQVPVLIFFGALMTFVMIPPIAEVRVFVLPIFVGIVFAVWFVVLIAVDLFEALFGVDLLLLMQFWKKLPGLSDGQ